MDPHKQWCHNPDCPARGQVGQGNIHIHSYKEQRYRCGICERTFAATKGTPFFGSSVFAVGTPRCCGYRHGYYRVTT